MSRPASRLSARVRAVCREHWTPAEARCVGCPLYSPCHAGTGPRLTHATLTAWVDALNRAADQLEQPGDDL